MLDETSKQIRTKVFCHYYKEFKGIELKRSNTVFDYEASNKTELFLMLQ